MITVRHLTVPKVTCFQIDYNATLPSRRAIYSYFTKTCDNSLHSVAISPVSKHFKQYASNPALVSSSYRSWRVLVSVSYYTRLESDRRVTNAVSTALDCTYRRARAALGNNRPAVVTDVSVRPKPTGCHLSRGLGRLDFRLKRNVNVYLRV